MTRDVRIIDGKLKVVHIVDNKIVKIIRDYDKIKKNQTKEGKEEFIHEINYGKRQRYQKPHKTIKGPDIYRKDLLKRKVDAGIIKEGVLKLKSMTQLLNEWAKERGFINYEEYLNIIALGRGFTCYGEYDKVWIYYPSMPSPMKENRRDPRFLGMYIAENGITKIFQGSQKMPYGNPGYDIICPKGYKIDVKATTLNPYNNFIFHIGRNMTADYFILVAFDNIIELKPLHIWIIKSDENIEGSLMKNLDSLTITDELYCLDLYKKYEKIEKLEELRKICEEFNINNKVEVKDFNLPNKSMILDVIYMLKSERKYDILPTDVLCILDKLKRQLIEKGAPLKVSITPKDECKYSGQH